MVKLESTHATMEVRHRALCEEGDYRGPWRSDVQAAIADANRHGDKPGNETHVIRIETQQKSSFRLDR